MTARQALSLLVVATVGAVVLHSAGSTLPAPPLAEPARLAGWWTGQGTPAAVLSVARIVGMALCCYLALISLLGTVASLTRWRWTHTLAIWVATPALRRMIAGGTLAAAMTSSYTAAAAPVAYVVTEIVEAQATAATGVPADTAAVPQERFDVHTVTVPQERFDVHTVTDIGAAPIGPARYSVSDLGPAHAESEDRLAGPADDRATDSPHASAAAGPDDSPRTTTGDTARADSSPHTTTRDATRADHQAHTTTRDTAPHRSPSPPGGPRHRRGRRHARPGRVGHLDRRARRPSLGNRRRDGGRAQRIRGPHGGGALLVEADRGQCRHGGRQPGSDLPGPTHSPSWLSDRRLGRTSLRRAARRAAAATAAVSARSTLGPKAT